MRIKTPGKRELTRLYKELGSICALADYLGCSSWVVCDRFRKLGIKLIERHSEWELKFPSHEKMLELYAQCKNKQKLARYLKAPYGAVRWWFDKHGVPTSTDTRKYTVNDDFFSTDNELSFYWAGFIAADGCIRGPTNMVLDLSAKDNGHLLRFLKDIGSNAPIKTRYSSNPSNKKELCQKSIVGITSGKIVKDLQRFNIVPCKSATFSLPQWLLKHKLLHHFIRGWLDGDGFFGVRKALNSPFVGICGNIKSVTQFRDIMADKCGVSKVKVQVRGESKRYEYTYGVCHFFGRFSVAKIRDYLYKDATVFLRRKFNNAQLADNFADEEIYQ